MKWFLCRFHTYMRSEGKICLEEGSDGSNVFPVIIEQISLLKIFVLEPLSEPNN